MSETLPGMEPNPAQILAYAQARPLDEKIDRAIEALRHYEAAALRLSEDGYWLAFSGGKDSIVILDLARQAGVAFKAVYNVTTIDPPELVRFIKREHPDVEWNRPRIPMLLKLSESTNGPPTRAARWCSAFG